MPHRLDNRYGFAVLIALLAMIGIGALVIGAHQVASSQFRLGQARRAANAAFYSAEAGLAAAMGGWDHRLTEDDSPGHTRKLLEGRLASGDGYHVWVTRLDNGSDRWRSLYLVRSVGLAHGSRGGRRQVGLLVRVPKLDAFCCFDRAVLPAETVPGARDAGIASEAEDPEESHDTCDDPGRPADESEGGRDTVLQRARALYDILSSRPELFIDAADTTVADLAPGSDRPVTHATGDLTLRSGSGHGVLLVDGNLVLDAGFEFRGIVLARGNVSLEGQGTRIVGTVVLLDPRGGSVLLGPAAEVVYSRCQEWRALRESGLGNPRPLAQHAWLEIFK